MTIDLRTSSRIKNELATTVRHIREILAAGQWSVLANADLLDSLNDRINNDLTELRDRGDATDRPREGITA